MLSLEKKMAGVLVKWVVEGTVSTILAGWIFEPEALPPNERKVLLEKKEIHWKHLFQVNIC